MAIPLVFLLILTSFSSMIHVSQSAETVLVSAQPQHKSEQTHTAQPQHKSEQTHTPQPQHKSEQTHTAQPQHKIEQTQTAQPQHKSAQHHHKSAQTQHQSAQTQTPKTAVMSTQTQATQPELKSTQTQAPTVLMSAQTQPAPPQLSLDYYAKTCPDFDRILLEIITPKQSSNPSTAAATLRVFFHDCFVQGCDGSVLINPNAAVPTERDQSLNLDLPGDAFDIIVRVKTALELSCPGIVSCTDILAATTRHLIKQVGGPFYKVLLGRKDGLVSMASNVDHNLGDEKQTFDVMLAPFLEKGFTVREMVALLGGGHTIGFAHCNKFASRIFNFSSTSEVDPSLNPAFAERLRAMCANYTTRPDMAAFLDPMSPGKFDNNFFSNLLRGLDILPSDHLMLLDPRSKPLVEEYAKDQNKFFNDFVQAMEKLSLLGVKTGLDGEVRTNCFASANKRQFGSNFFSSGIW